MGARQGHGEEVSPPLHQGRDTSWSNSAFRTGRAGCTSSQQRSYKTRIDQPASDTCSSMAAGQVPPAGHQRRGAVGLDGD